MNPQIRMLLDMLSKIPAPGREGPMLDFKGQGQAPQQGAQAPMNFQGQAQEPQQAQMPPNGVQLGQPHIMRPQVEVGTPQIAPQAEPDNGGQPHAIEFTIGTPELVTPKGTRSVEVGTPEITKPAPKQMSIPGITIRVPHHIAPQFMAALLENSKKKKK